jgi:hypothetical protein
MPRKPKCPGFVITAAVLLFIYGALKLICSFCGAAEMAIVAAAPAPQAPPGQPDFGDLFAGERELAKQLPSYTAVEGANNLLNLLLGGSMILAGAGALRLKRFARILGNGAAAADLVLTLAYLVYTAVVVFPVNDRIMEEQMQNAAAFASSISSATLVFLFLLTLIFCAPIIGFLNAKKSRDAFAGKFEPDPHEERLARLDAFNDEDDYYRRPRSSPPKSPGDTGVTGE